MIIRGKAYLDRDVKEVDIKIEDGKIVKIAKELHDNKIIDYTRCKCIILPAMIDIHVHLRDFKEDYKEDIFTGTAAAAAGGVGIVVEMPNTDPRINNLKTLVNRNKLNSSKAVIDYGIFYGVPDDVKDISDYEKYSIGLKVYPSDYKKEMLHKILLYNSIKKILTIFHPEDPDLINDRHPLKAELNAAIKISRESIETGFPAHLTHITSGSTLRIAKNINKNITVDTCPHYIFISGSNSDSKYYNVTPPLREENIRRELFNLFLNGYIDALSTDHAPHTYEEKYIDGLNGFPGLETALPLLITLYKKGLISLSKIVKLYSKNPAKILGLDDKFGSIKEGAYASITVINIDKEYSIDPSKFYSKAKHSPFLGWRVYGEVVSTYVRGIEVYRDGEIVKNKGYGENIRWL